MQLTYRGVAYQSLKAPVELSRFSQIGKYRGKATKISSTVQVLRQSLSALKYRGVDYTQQIGDRHLQPIIFAVENESI